MAESTILTRKSRDFGLSLPIPLLEALDRKRGDIPRAKYIRRLVEKDLELSKNLQGATIETRGHQAEELTSTGERSNG